MELRRRSRCLPDAERAAEMILVDTNVWIDHFNDMDAELVTNLNIGAVACHPYIIGEIACGKLKKRKQIIGLFDSLPSAPVLEPEEILSFIQARKLMGKGLGYVDMQLLASTVLSGLRLWTEDKKLKKAAKGLGVSYKR